MKKLRHRPNDPASRRFHRRGRDKVKLRGWEVVLWNALFNTRSPELKLWASVLCDALRTIYVSRSERTVRETLAWILATARDSLMDFEPMCEALDVEPGDIRSALANDVRSGLLTVKLGTVTT